MTDKLEVYRVLRFYYSLAELNRAALDALMLGDLRDYAHVCSLMRLYGGLP
jgi:hypothetical protein